jgi:hypothetical protein
VAVDVPTQPYISPAGETLPSVTQVIRLLAKPGLVEWAYNLGLKRISLHKHLGEVSQIGTDVHALITRFLLDADKVPANVGNPDPTDPELVEPFRQFLDWYQDHDPEPRLVENPLIDAELGYGGTVDLVAQIDGKLELVDFKTSHAIHEDHLYQLAAYDHLLAVNHIHIARARIVQIGRSQDRYREVIAAKDELAKRFEVFCCLLRIHQLQKEIGHARTS